MKRKLCEHPPVFHYVYLRPDGFKERRCRRCRALYARAWRRSWGVGAGK